MSTLKNSSKLKILKLVLLFLLVILLDQVTKFWFSQNLVLTINTGFSFGMINNLPVVVISALQIFFLLVVVGLIRLKKIDEYQAIIILAAGSSNLIDRWIFSGVRDIFYLPVLNLTNNLADWLIFLTIIVWIFNNFKQEFK